MFKPFHDQARQFTKINFCRVISIFSHKFIGISAGAVRLQAYHQEGVCSRCRSVLLLWPTIRFFQFIGSTRRQIPDILLATNFESGKERMKRRISLTVPRVANPRRRSVPNQTAFLEHDHSESIKTRL